MDNWDDNSAPPPEEDPWLPPPTHPDGTPVVTGNPWIDTILNSAPPSDPENGFSPSDQWGDTNNGMDDPRGYGTAYGNDNEPTYGPNPDGGFGSAYGPNPNEDPFNAAYEPSSRYTMSPDPTATATQFPDLPFGLGYFADSAEAATDPVTAARHVVATQYAKDNPTPTNTPTPTRTFTPTHVPTPNMFETRVAMTETAKPTQEAKNTNATSTAEARHNVNATATETERILEGRNKAATAQANAVGTATTSDNRTATAEARNTQEANNKEMTATAKENRETPKGLREEAHRLLQMATELDKDRPSGSTESSPDAQMARASAQELLRRANAMQGVKISTPTQSPTPAPTMTPTMTTFQSLNPFRGAPSATPTATPGTEDTPEDAPSGPEYGPSYDVVLKAIGDAIQATNEDPRGYGSAYDRPALSQSSAPGQYQPSIRPTRNIPIEPPPSTEWGLAPNIVQPSASTPAQKPARAAATTPPPAQTDSSAGPPSTPTSSAPGNAGAPVRVELPPQVDQWRQVAEQAFGDLGPAAVDHVLALMKYESGGNANAHNTKGEDSRGLMQINVGDGANTDMRGRDLFNPAENLKAAREVFNRQGWGAWATEPIVQRDNLDKSMPRGSGAPSSDADSQRVVDMSRTSDRSMPGASSGAATGAPEGVGKGAPFPKPTGNEKLDNAIFLQWAKANVPGFVAPEEKPEAPVRAPRAPAAPREPAAPRSAPATPIPTSPSKTYTTKTGIKTLDQMKTELKNANWPGNYDDEQEVLQAYKRTTGGDVTPKTGVTQSANVTRWTPNIAKSIEGTGVPADVVLAAMHVISNGSTERQGGLLGVHNGSTEHDGNESINAGLKILKDEYAKSGNWELAFYELAKKAGLSGFSDAVLRFNQARSIYGAPA